MIAIEEEFFERGEALAWDVARHHGMMGVVEGALRWLRISLDRHEERLIGLYVDGIRPDPLQPGSPPARRRHRPAAAGRGGR